jgi:hypothetical protein
MDNIVKTASIVVFLILFVHVFLLMLHNAFRIKKLLKYIDKFKNEGKLNENDYQLLYDRYTSFFSYLEFYPDKIDFRTLYENSEFDSYVRRSKWKLKYYSIVAGTAFAILLILPFDN